MSNFERRTPFEMTPELQARVDQAWSSFTEDPLYAVAIAQAASSLLARRGELPHAYKRGRPPESA